MSYIFWYWVEPIKKKMWGEKCENNHGKMIHSVFLELRIHKYNYKNYIEVIMIEILYPTWIFARAKYSCQKQKLVKG